MKQLIDEYTYTIAGVVNATPVDIMAIPFNSLVSDQPINIEVSCLGTSVDPTNTVTTRFFFVLPIMYFVTDSDAQSTPEEGVAVPYNSADFSKMVHSDSIANFNDLQVVPNPDTTSKTFKLELTVPNNSKNWDISVHVKLFKDKG